MIPVAEVSEHPRNPRDALGDLTELAALIKTLGPRQPILVVPARTFRANAIELPAHVRWVVRRLQHRSGHTAETFLAENLRRRGLSPLEEARAMALLIDLGFSQRQIAERGGFAQSHVSTRDFGGEQKIRVALESLGKPYDLCRQPGAGPRHSAR